MTRTSLTLAAVAALAFFAAPSQSGPGRPAEAAAYPDAEQLPPGAKVVKLSLRGYDPVFDYRALTDDLEGRRFNRAAPEKSLFLLKTSGAIPHQGGVLTQPGDPNYEMLRRWVGQGVRFDPESPRVRSL